MVDSEVAIVTGGAQGLGASITKVLLKRGFKVVVADIQEQTGEKFVKEEGKKHGPERLLFFRCDVRDLENFQSLFEFTIKQFKRVDLLMNNAGVICERDPKMVFDVNVMGPYNGCQLAMKYMGKDNGGNGGTVINTASIAGFLYHPGFPMYCASKHAVVGLTKSYGHQYYLQKTGIRFSALCPSFIRTGLLGVLNEHAIVKQGDFYNLPALLDPDEVAEGVNRLLDDKINGSLLSCTSDKGFFYVGIPPEFQNIDLK